MNRATFSQRYWPGPTVMASLRPCCTPESVSNETSTVAAIVPAFMRYSRVTGAPVAVPVPTNHMSEPGWAQVTVPMPGRWTPRPRSRAPGAGRGHRGAAVLAGAGTAVTVSAPGPVTVTGGVVSG